MLKRVSETKFEMPKETPSGRLWREVLLCMGIYVLGDALSLIMTLSGFIYSRLEAIIVGPESFLCGTHYSPQGMLLERAIEQLHYLS